MDAQNSAPENTVPEPVSAGSKKEWFMPEIKEILPVSSTSYDQGPASDGSGGTLS